jgi:hypothetical protein
MTPAKRSPKPAASKGPAKSSARSAARLAARPAGNVAARKKVPVDPAHPLPHDDLYARILRALRRSPNQVVELTPLAEELGMEPYALQLEVERLARRGFLVLPFIEPGAGGGALLAQRGLEWLIAHEGGRPKDVPVALKPAAKHVRAQDEAARLPRADVYGAGR